jgi:tight adherence protein C
LSPTYLLALLTAAGALTVFWAIRPVLFRSNQVTAVDERMQYYGADVGLTDDVAQLSFRERMIQPNIERISAAIAKLTPQTYTRSIDRRLEEAGRPSGLRAGGFIILSAAATIVAASVGLVLGAFLGNLLIALLAGGVLGAGAWIGISFWLGTVISARRHQVELALPNLIDFLVIGVSAGLTLDRALARVVSQQDNALTRGLAVALAEAQLGRPRLEALDAYGRSSGVKSVHNFIQAIIGSEQMGVPMAEILRVQAETARQRRSERAAQLGGAATIKMTIPMVVFIFPTIWLILLGPALFVIFKKGL